MVVRGNDPEPPSRVYGLSTRAAPAASTMSLRLFRRSRRPHALALGALLLAGCAVLEPEPQQADRRALARARALWERSGPSSYRYVYEPQCAECPPSAARAAWVTVENGVVIEASYVEGSDPVNAGPQVYGPVDSLFALVQRAYDERAARVRVEYDAALGYPTTLTVDWRRDVVDDEGGFRVPALDALAP